MIELASTFSAPIPLGFDLIPGFGPAVIGAVVLAILLVSVAVMLMDNLRAGTIASHGEQRRPRQGAPRPLRLSAGTQHGRIAA